LELEKDDRIDRRPSAGGIEWSNEIPDKGEVRGLVEVAIEMVSGD
jgi:hypothetical protein